MKKFIHNTLALSVFALPSLTAYGTFTCINPDLSMYRKCSAAELACNTYCSGTALTLCLEAVHSHTFPAEPCTAP